jgi:hypothetical protein
MSKIRSFGSKQRLSIAHEPINPRDPKSPWKWFIYRGTTRLERAYDSDDEARTALNTLALTPGD